MVVVQVVLFKPVSSVSRHELSFAPLLAYASEIDGIGVEHVCLSDGGIMERHGHGRF